MKEFNLSDKIEEVRIGFDICKVIHPEAVKEFIKRLKKEFINSDDLNYMGPCLECFNEIVDKLVGEKLK